MRHLITLMFLVLAIVLYAIGAALPATAVLVLGGAAEAVFWFRLYRGGRKSSRRQ